MSDLLDVDDRVTVDAFRRGDADVFDRISRRHFRELHVHCYRMIGSLDEAEDLVQETLLRAWRKRATYEGRATVRTWLYRIATNVCIEAIRKRSRRRSENGDATVHPSPWLQPCPDAVLDVAAGEDEQPDARAIARETIELAYLAAIQMLPAKQRAVLILRDVLDFSASDTAQLLDDTVPAVNSALQRARARLRRRYRTTDALRLPDAAPTASELALLRQFMAAQERTDPAAIVALLRADVQMTLFPDGRCWNGRHEVAPAILARMNTPGAFRCVAISANRQPAVAVYVRRPDDDVYRALAIVVLHVVDDEVREIDTFASPELFARFGLPPTH